MHDREPIAARGRNHDQHLEVADVRGQDQQAAAVRRRQGVGPMLLAIEAGKAARNSPA